MVFADIGEIEHALDSKVVTLHTKIKARYHDGRCRRQAVIQRVETTPGRMLMSRNPAADIRTCRSRWSTGC